MSPKAAEAPRGATQEAAAQATGAVAVSSHRFENTKVMLVSSGFLSVVAGRLLKQCQQICHEHELGLEQLPMDGQMPQHSGAGLLVLVFAADSSRSLQGIEACWQKYQKAAQLRNWQAALVIHSSEQNSVCSQEDASSLERETNLFFFQDSKDAFAAFLLDQARLAGSRQQEQPATAARSSIWQRFLQNFSSSKDVHRPQRAITHRQWALIVYYAAMMLESAYRGAEDRIIVGSGDDSDVDFGSHDQLASEYDSQRQNERIALFQACMDLAKRNHPVPSSLNPAEKKQAMDLLLSMVDGVEGVPVPLPRQETGFASSSPEQNSAQVLDSELLPTAQQDTPASQPSALQDEGLLDQTVPEPETAEQPDQEDKDNAIVLDPSDDDSGETEVDDDFAGAQEQWPQDGSDSLEGSNDNRAETDHSSAAVREGGQSKEAAEETLPRADDEPREETDGSSLLYPQDGGDSIDGETTSCHAETDHSSAPVQDEAETLSRPDEPLEEADESSSQPAIEETQHGDEQPTDCDHFHAHDTEATWHSPFG